MINTGFEKNNHFAYNCLNATSHYTNCPCNSSHWKRLHERFSSGYANIHTSMPLFFFIPVEPCYKMKWSCYLFADYSLSFLEGILSKARPAPLFCSLTNQVPTQEPSSSCRSSGSRAVAGGQEWTWRWGGAVTQQHSSADGTPRTPTTPTCTCDSTN